MRPPGRSSASSNCTGHPGSGARWAAGHSRPKAWGMDWPRVCAMVEVLIGRSNHGQVDAVVLEVHQINLTDSNYHSFYKR